MKIRLELHPEAVREVDAAVDWSKASARAWEPNSFSLRPMMVVERSRLPTSAFQTSMASPKVACVRC
ncbi:hypothetical protein JQX13_04145 [Archangium violaceum]|uniref:hypothetical protein n=1 Tax=Archangium violaceum TaxID=83451 RepID=UPI00193B8BEF|nr:hypothetical protein [Archangium violaceum]QRK09347.1 hypothetical protein JQX13_04145 [Archangium violaceum]